MHEPLSFLLSFFLVLNAFLSVFLCIKELLVSSCFQYYRAGMSVNNAQLLTTRTAIYDLEMECVSTVWQIQTVVLTKVPVIRNSH